MKPSIPVVVLLLLAAGLYLRYSGNTSASSDPQLSANCNHPDSAALMAFYHATNGPNWTQNDGWGDTCDVCTWFGVGCDGERNIIVLDLRNNNLSGEIPSTLGTFSDLELLNLSSNNFSGAIPFQLGELASLRTLYLNDNALSGDIPTSLNNLELENFIAYNNRLSGSIPPLTNSNNLSGLNLSNNLLTGAIHQAIFSKANLRVLYLQNNQLSETLPENIGGLVNLRFLNLSNNNIEGELPDGIGGLLSVQICDLSNNNLNGTLPSTIGDLSSVSVLALYENEFSGTLPSELANLAKPFISIWINDNNFEGCIPAGFEAFCSAGSFIRWQNNTCLQSYSQFCSGESCQFFDYTLTATTDTPCKDEQISVTASGGVSYQWNTGEATNSIEITADSSQWFSVHLETFSGCMRTDSIFIEVREKPQLSFSKQDVMTYGGMDGYIDLIISSGEPPYEISWSTGQTSDLIQNLAAGIYEVTVADQYGCTNHQSIEILQPACYPAGTLCDDGNPDTYNDTEDGNCNCLGIPCPELQINADIQDISCSGLADASIDLTFAGGQSPYQAIWDDGNSGTLRTVLTSGVYTVTVTDDFGCSAMATYQISEPEPLVLIVKATDESIPDAQDGAIDLTVIGGSSPYTFSWSNGATTEDLSGLSGEGNLYEVTVTDMNECQATASAILETGCYPAGTPCDDGNPDTYNDTEDGNCTCLGIPCPDISVVSDVQPLSCYMNGDGGISLSITGGAAPYDLLWSDGDTSAVRQALAAGIYTVTITDAGGCVRQEAFLVHQPKEIELRLEPTDESIAAASDGEIFVEVSGGIPPYSINWSTGATASKISGLVGGGSTYSVSVTDQHGCLQTDSVVLQTGCLPQGTACDDDDPDTFQDQEDGNCGCIGTPCPVLEASIDITHVSCFGAADGSINIEVEGGQAPYEIRWNIPVKGFEVFGLPAGIYNCEIRDVNGCSNRFAVAVDQPEPIDIAIVVDSSQSNLWIISSEVSGGYSPYHLEWSTGDTSRSITVDPKLIDSVSLKVSDNNHCTDELSLFLQSACIASGQSCDDNKADTHSDSIDQNCNCVGIPCPEPSYELTWHPDNCFGNQLIANVSGEGITVQWPDSANGMSWQLPGPGSWPVKLQNEIGCTWKDTLVVPPYAPLNLFLESVNASGIGTEDGAIQVVVVGGIEPYTYKWSTGDHKSQVSNLPGDQFYTVTVTDEAGCTLTDSVYVSADLCSSLERLQAASYQIRSYLIDGCSSSGHIDIDLPLQDFPNLLWSIDGGVNFQNAPQFAGLTEGNYTILVTDHVANCSLQFAEVVIESRLPELGVMSQDPSTCAGKDGWISILSNPDSLFIGLNADGPWYADTIPQLAAGNYALYGFLPQQRCVLPLDLSIVLGDDFDVSPDITIVDAACEEEFGQIQISGIDNSYEFSLNQGNQWHPGDRTFLVTPGTYQLWLRSDTCIQVLESDVVVDQIELYGLESLIVNQPAQCANSTGSIAIPPLYSDLEISLDAGDNWTSMQWESLVPGDYEVMIRQKEGQCSSSLIVSIEAPAAKWAIDTLVLPPSCYGSEDGYIQLEVIETDKQFVYTWSHGPLQAAIPNLKAGLYQVTIREEGTDCSMQLDFNLDEPEPLQLVLPELMDSTLCLGTTLDLTLEDSSLHYQWFKEMQMIGSGSHIQINQPGTYLVEARDSLGCLAMDSLSVQYAESLFEPNFLIPSFGVVGQAIAAIEISWPVPEDIEWWISGGTTSDTMFNQAQFLFDQPGVYKVQLNAQMGSCMASISKNIKIFDDASLLPDGASVDGSNIKTAIVYPNPNRGRFDLEVETKSITDIQIRIYRPDGDLVQARQYVQTDRLNEALDLTGALPGIYTVLVQTLEGWKSINVVIE